MFKKLGPSLVQNKITSEFEFYFLPIWNTARFKKKDAYVYIFYYSVLECYLLGLFKEQSQKRRTKNRIFLSRLQENRTDGYTQWDVCIYVGICSWCYLNTAGYNCLCFVESSGILIFSKIAGKSEGTSIFKNIHIYAKYIHMFLYIQYVLFFLGKWHHARQCALLLLFLNPLFCPKLSPILFLVFLLLC